MNLEHINAITQYVASEIAAMMDERFTGRRDITLSLHFSEGGISKAEVEHGRKSTLNLPKKQN